jgi:hypothetical protein
LTSAPGKLLLQLGIGKRGHCSHLLHVLLVQNFPDGQQLDDSARALVERGAFLFGVAGMAMVNLILLG